MDCKEFVKTIPDFIDNRLNFFKMRDFCRHMEECGECREELDIQFLVTEGMQRLEEGDVFDLQKELDTKLGKAGKNLKYQEYALETGFVLEVFLVVAFLGVLVWIVF